jgi:hypothetical protein
MHSPLSNLSVNGFASLLLSIVSSHENLGFFCDARCFIINPSVSVSRRTSQSTVRYELRSSILSFYRSIQESLFELTSLCIRGSCMRASKCRSCSLGQDTLTVGTHETWLFQTEGATTGVFDMTYLRQIFTVHS